MKAKCLGILMVILTFIGCDDNTGSIGLGMLPDSDKLSVKTKTFEVHTSSFLADSVFSKTDIGYVGKYTDPHFGFYESSFLTQFNCTENLKFPTLYSESNKEGIMAGDSIVSTELILYYSNYFGDPYNPSRMSIYELTETLDKNHYTTIDPSKFYKEQDLLARKAYTAIDLSVLDSLRNLEDYWDHIRFSLSKDLGKRIRDLNWEHPEYFSDGDEFSKHVFNGIYVKNDFGDGTVLYVDRVALNITYNCYEKDTLNNLDIMKNYLGGDSIYLSGRTFEATKEVIQANRFTNEESLKELAEETEHTYIKSPAGIFTRAILPIQEIYDELHSDTLNSVKLEFTGYQPEKNDIDEQFQMKTPMEILLVREKEMKSFFENNLLADNITSYLFQSSVEVRTYTFNNITYLINTCIDEKEEVKKGEGKDWTDEQWEEWEKETKWNSILLVPVKVITDGQQSTSVISIQNDMAPGYIKLQGGEKDILNLEIHYTIFH